MAAIDAIKSRAEETMTTILSHRMAGPLGKAMHVTAQCAFWVVRWPSSTCNRINSRSRTKCTATLVELTVVVKLVAVAVVELQTDRMTRLK